VYRRMGVADLCNACSDWSTDKNVGLHFGEVGNKMSATLVGICKQAVNPRMNELICNTHRKTSNCKPLFLMVDQPPNVGKREQTVNCE